MNAIDYAKRKIEQDKLEAEQKKAVEHSKHTALIEQRNNLIALAESILNPLKEHGFEIQKFENQWNIYKKCGRLNTLVDTITLCYNEKESEYNKDFGCEVHQDAHYSLSSRNSGCISKYMTETEIDKFNLKLGNRLAEMM